MMMMMMMVCVSVCVCVYYWWLKNETNLNLRSSNQLIVSASGMSLTTNTLALRKRVARKNFRIERTKPSLIRLHFWPLSSFFSLLSLSLPHPPLLQTIFCLLLPLCLPFFPAHFSTRPLRMYITCIPALLERCSPLSLSLSLSLSTLLSVLRVGLYIYISFSCCLPLAST